MQCVSEKIVDVMRHWYASVSLLWSHSTPAIVFFFFVSFFIQHYAGHIWFAQQNAIVEASVCLPLCVEAHS